MEQSELILRLSVSEVSAARVERLILFAHLRAGASIPRARRPELLILCRDDSGCPPPWITRSAITDQDTARLVRLLEAAGFPERRPRVKPDPGPTHSGQRVGLEVSLNGRTRSMKLALEHGGFSGPDAEAVRAVLQRLGELAEAVGRPSVRAILDVVTHEGRPEPPAQPASIGARRGEEKGSGMPPGARRFQPGALAPTGRGSA